MPFAGVVLMRELPRSVANIDKGLCCSHRAEQLISNVLVFGGYIKQEINKEKERKKERKKKERGKVMKGMG